MRFHFKNRRTGRSVFLSQIDSGGGIPGPTIPIEVVTDREAEQADMVVCVAASQTTPFKDDAMGTCADCGNPIRFRPYVPKLPPKVCIPCATKRMGEKS